MAGDEVAAVKVFRAVQPALLSYLRSQLPAEAVEDAAAEVWLAVARGSAASVCSFDQLRALLFTIARRRAIDLRRSRRRHPENLGHDPAELAGVDPTDEVVDQMSAGEAVRRIVEVLPPNKPRWSSCGWSPGSAPTRWPRSPVGQPARCGSSNTAPFGGSPPSSDRKPSPREPTCRRSLRAPPLADRPRRRRGPPRRDDAPGLRAALRVAVRRPACPRRTGRPPRAAGRRRPHRRGRPEGRSRRWPPGSQAAHRQDRRHRHRHHHRPRRDERRGRHGHAAEPGPVCPGQEPPPPRPHPPRHRRHPQPDRRRRPSPPHAHIYLRYLRDSRPGSHPTGPQRVVAGARPTRSGEGRSAGSSSAAHRTPPAGDPARASRPPRARPPRIQTRRARWSPRPLPAPARGAPLAVALAGAGQTTTLRGRPGLHAGSYSVAANTATGTTHSSRDVPPWV